MRYWKFLDENRITTSVQSCSNNEHEIPDAVEIDKSEFADFLASLPTLEPEPAIHFVPGTPGQSAAKRIDNIEEFLKQLYP